MSGTEFLAVIGGISAIVDLAGKIKEIYKTVENLHGIPQAFSLVNERLPIVVDILNTAQRHLEKEHDEAVCKGIRLMVERCKTCTVELKRIFEAVKPNDGAWKMEQYYMAVRAKGKESKVENLMASVLENVNLLNAQRGMLTASADQQQQILVGIKELSEVTPSVPDSEFPVTGVTMNQSGTGFQAHTVKGNVYSSGGGKQYIGGTAALVISCHYSLRFPCSPSHLDEESTK